MKTILFLLFFLLVTPIIFIGQKVSNIHFEQAGKQIHIYYDLYGDQEYTIQVFCSTNDGKSWGNKLKYVSGEVGENQKPGNNKMIVWDVLAEREQLSGEIRFKIDILPSNTGFFTDARDGQTYKLVNIGNQIWMAENLNFKTKSGSWAYDYNLKNAAIYGRLYDWNTALIVCPGGWHLPSDSEWDILVDYLGASSVAGGKMKETGTTHWESVNSGVTNSSGFTALPGGYRYTDGHFYNLGDRGNWWSATEHSSARAWYRYLYYNNDKVSRHNGSKDCGFSVRCLRD